MTFTQLVCLQLIFILVSQQVLANPVLVESSDGLVHTSQNLLPVRSVTYDNIEEMLTDFDNYENIRKHIYNKLAKRRTQAKANLAGLWGVPTRFA